MPRLYNYEAIAYREIKDNEDVVCMPGKGTMLEAIAVAMAGNSQAMNVEKHFNFAEPLRFDPNIHINLWFVRRTNRS